MKIRVVCSKCGKEPERNEAMSNQNWSVIDNKPCIYCGGTLKMDFGEQQKNKRCKKK